MMEPVVSDHNEEEGDDDSIPRTTGGSSQKDGPRSDERASSQRFKHSEAEQRRRNKINEGYQILRDLLPENDGKRDKASILLEVIEYIQLLQERLQMHEGTNQGCSQDPTKLMPLRGNSGVDNIVDESQLVKNGSTDEDNIVLNPAFLTNEQNLVESNLSVSAAFKATDNGATQAAQTIFEPESAQTSPGFFSDVELLTSHLQPQPLSSEGAIAGCFPNEPEEPKMPREEASFSNAKGLLHNITQSLESSGVDLSQASISVLLDIQTGNSSGETLKSCAIKPPG